MPFDADFFTDLGGHSLLAARFISAVRETPALAGITLQDVYGARTLRAWPTLSMSARRRIRSRARISPSRRRLAAPLPLRAARRPLALPFILGLVTAQWLGMFVSYMLLTGED